MSDFTTREFDSDADRTPIRAGQLSSNGQWVFGSIYAVLALVGFSFGVWAGASKPKPVEVADAKQKEDAKPKDAQEKPAPKPVAVLPAVTPPQPAPVEPKPMEPEPKPKEPEPKPKEPEPKPKEPEPKKPPVKAVAFKEVAPMLRTYCGNCHGMAGKPKAGVDLRTVASIMKGGDDGAIVKAGDPDKSPLYDSIKAGRMPPDGKPAPTEKDLMLLRDWIQSGAKERRRIVRRRSPRQHQSRDGIDPNN